MAAQVPNQRTINLARQGGGAHGAFTQGVLDRLLVEESIAIEGISGTSAGAINAAMLAQGHLKGGAAGARADLDRFWLHLSELGWLSPVHRTLYERAVGSRNIDASPAALFVDQLTRMVSRYQLNPLSLAPLRDLLTPMLDWDALRHPDSIKLSSPPPTRTPARRACSRSTR